MGNPSGKYEYQASLIAMKEVQVSHNALEAARVATNRILSAKLENEYFFRVLTYPHAVLRENKMIFGAHADRLQDGMRRAFGKAIGTAARVKRRQAVLRVNVNENGLEVAKTALKRGGAKLPVTSRISIEKLNVG